MKLNTLAAAMALATATTFSATTAQAYEYKADVTDYPVVFAHGMIGWDSLLGHAYFGDDLWGTFVGDSCGFLEIDGCNEWIDRKQQTDNKAVAFQVASLNSSEVRGEELYNHVRNLMASTGYTKVNFVGHSQGGFDIRKAAHRLKDTAINGVPAGTAKVGAMISISSPHRGTSYAKAIIDSQAYDENGVYCDAKPMNADGSHPCEVALAVIADNLFDFINGDDVAGNSLLAAGTQLLYDDISPDDGKITGAKVFNQNYSSEGVAGYVGSFVTGQDDRDLNPILMAAGGLFNHNADGDGYCVDDCDGDGAAGKGNGNAYDNDDDGLVPINSQQMGTRLKYNPKDCAGFLCLAGNPLDTITEEGSTGYVANLNYPNATQMTSRKAVIDKDHLDVISLGPDEFDEKEFYAAIIDFIEAKGY